MAQARTLNDKELKQLLAYIAIRRHAARNRCMALVTHWSGMRVGEVAALRYCDVLDSTGQVLSEVRLMPDQTKGKHPRTVFIPDRLRKEIAHYINLRPFKVLTQPLFYTQKRAGWTANTLTQHFHYMYQRAGLNGASSHSGRRSFITKLASKGVGVRVLQALAGHRSIGTTQAYIDVNDAMKKAAVELI